MRRQLTAYNDAVGAYGEQAAVFKTCQATMSAARTKEEDAHHQLQQVMERPSSDDALDVAAITPAIMARASSYISTLEGGRAGAISQYEKLLGKALAYDRFANGALIGASSHTLGWFKEAATKSRADAKIQLARASQFERWVKVVPSSVRRIATLYPGKERLNNVLYGDHARQDAAKARGILKKLPYVGSGITLGTEVAGAARGEQSWTKAGVDTVSKIGGSALGSTVMSAGASAYAAHYWGRPLGPVGTLATATIGGIAGFIGGEKVADVIMPN